jgi:hypothetical protein
MKNLMTERFKSQRLLELFFHRFPQYFTWRELKTFFFSNSVKFALIGKNNAIRFNGKVFLKHKCELFKKI